MNGNKNIRKFLRMRRRRDVMSESKVELSAQLQVEKILGEGFVVKDDNYLSCPRHIIGISVSKKWWIFSFMHTVAAISWGDEMRIYDPDPKYLSKLKVLAEKLGIKATLTKE